MKKVLVFAILLIVITLTGLLTQLPWWSFTVPVFFMGVLLPLQKWKVLPFVWGFLAGFLVWLMATVYFNSVYDGEFMNSVAQIGNVSITLLYVVIGLIGGVLSGLAFYSGYLLRKGREALKLELPKE